MRSTPADEKLYKKVKKAVYAKQPVHSAYRSASLVREYKKAFAKKHGKKSPYTGGPGTRLRRWFKEEWRTQDGKKTYEKKGDIFRPTRRVSKETPTTTKNVTILFFLIKIIKTT